MELIFSLLVAWWCFPSGFSSLESRFSTFRGRFDPGQMGGRFGTRPRASGRSSRGRLGLGRRCGLRRRPKRRGGVRVDAQGRGDKRQRVRDGTRLQGHFESTFLLPFDRERRFRFKLAVVFCHALLCRGGDRNPSRHATQYVFHRQVRTLNLAGHREFIGHGKRCCRQRCVGLRTAVRGKAAGPLGDESAEVCGELFA